jgi:pimeloyl-ACP methyl ester carboxylesterase
MKMNNSSVFRSTQGKAKILDYYNNILSQFPIEKKYIDTIFGKTFLLEAGDKKNPPVILLHGSCTNSASWLGDMPILARSYHVLAVDIPGEPGNSQDIRLDFNGNDYPNWLCEVLDALAIESAVIIGNSMGGWLGLHFAATYYNRTKALVLIAPSGIVSPRTEFIDDIADISGNTEKAKSINEALLGEAKVPKEVIEFMFLVIENFNPVTQALPILTNEQMLCLKMPVFYVSRTDDVTTDVTEAVKRLKDLVPHAQISLSEGSHVIASAMDVVVPYLSEIL